MCWNIEHVTVTLIVTPLEHSRNESAVGVHDKILEQLVAFLSIISECLYL